MAKHRIVSPKKVKKCNRCGNSVIKLKAKSKLVTSDVYHEDGFYVVLIKNDSILEHKCYDY